MMITDKQFDVLVREGYDRTYASRLTKRQASRIISEIFAKKDAYKLNPYDHEKVVASVRAVLNDMERSR
jgi:hypothetical protein